MTVLDLIKSSLRLIGATTTGEELSDNEAADALSALNALLDSWGLERLVIYDVSRQTFALVASQTSFTIGTNGNFNITRPNFIEAAALILSGQTRELPVEVLSDQQYQERRDKVSTGTPYAIWYEKTFPLGKIWPIYVPNAADTLVLYPWTAIPRFAATSDTFSLPPGYERALKYALAVELAPEYEKSAPAEVVQTAAIAKADIKLNNLPDVFMSADPALLRRGVSGYVSRNIYTGDC